NYAPIVEKSPRFQLESQEWLLNASGERGRSPGGWSNSSLDGGSSIRIFGSRSAQISEESGNRVMAERCAHRRERRCPSPTRPARNGRPAASHRHLSSSLDSNGPARGSGSKNEPTRGLEVVRAGEVLLARGAYRAVGTHSRRPFTRL